MAQIWEVILFVSGDKLGIHQINCMHWRGKVYMHKGVESNDIEIQMRETCRRGHAIFTSSQRRINSAVLSDGTPVVMPDTTKVYVHFQATRASLQRFQIIETFYGYLALI